MRLFGEFRGPGVGDPDLEGAQSLITQSNSVFGDSLPHVTVSHDLHVTCNLRVGGPTGEGHYLLSDDKTTRADESMPCGHDTLLAYIANMRRRRMSVTQIDLDDQALAEVMRIAGVHTKKEAVNLAMRDYVERFRRVAALAASRDQARDWDYEGWLAARAAEKALGA